ncbi:tyrosine-protein kinase Mer [Aplochiton taeniatus]
MGLNLGKISLNGFHLGFSYSGTCVFLASARLYYKTCPEFVRNQVRFQGAGAGSGLQPGVCVKGAVEVSPPEGDCQVEGVWGQQQGQCVCSPGHQPLGDICQACKPGYYKPANESVRCHPCPPNSGAVGEGAEKCTCLEGFFSLPTDPLPLGCTKPPSAPVNITVHAQNDSVLALLWGLPHDTGGRQEVMYDVACLEKEGNSWGQWKACGEGMIFLPASAGLTTRGVNITGVNPHSDYQLSVRAWNRVSVLQRHMAASVASVTIHKWKSPVIITIAPAPLPDPSTPHPSPQEHDSPTPLIIVGCLLGVLLLLALIPVVVCTLRKKYTKLSSNQDQEVELLPTNVGLSYRHPEERHIEPDVNTAGASGVVQILEGVNVRLLASLREVLVDRNQLTLGKELGKGEFGSVYEGLFTPEEGVDIKVAVKTMKVGIYNQEDLEDFLKEAEIMQHFDHENVVKLLGVTLDREQDSPLPVPLVILPFIKHGDLRRFLIATRYGDIPMFVPHQSLLRFMIDIAAGMKYLSDQGFLHRDLAARNCMLGDDLRVRVADFGLSKKIYSSNYYRQKVAVRMPIKWMAVESLSESIYTSKSDVWSFGVTMWEIVSRGRTPYPGVHNYELLDLLTSGHRLKQTECDHKLYEVMLSCWHLEPAHRPGFMELGERLKALLSELPALEASQEAHYINQGLEAACQGGAHNDEHLEVEESAMGNIYLPAPVCSTKKPTNTFQEDELEDGYLLCVKSD